MNIYRKKTAVWRHYFFMNQDYIYNSLEYAGSRFPDDVIKHADCPILVLHCDGVKTHPIGLARLVVHRRAAVASDPVNELSITWNRTGIAIAEVLGQHGAIGGAARKQRV